MFHLISVNFEARVETDDDIVGEDSRWRLYRPTPLRWKDVKLKMLVFFKLMSFFP